MAILTRYWVDIDTGGGGDEDQHEVGNAVNDNAR
jgi:hypothetical protein